MEELHWKWMKIKGLKLKKKKIETKKNCKKALSWEQCKIWVKFVIYPIFNEFYSINQLDDL